MIKLFMEFDEIKNYRLKNKLTQTEMADALGVSRSTYLRWEAGKSIPQMFHQRKLVDFFSSLNISQSLEKCSYDGIDISGIWIGNTVQPNYRPEYLVGEIIKYPLLVAFYKDINPDNFKGIFVELWFNALNKDQRILTYSCDVRIINQNDLSLNYYSYINIKKEYLGNALFHFNKNHLFGSFNGKDYNTKTPVHGEVMLKKSSRFFDDIYKLQDEYLFFEELVKKQKKFWINPIDNVDGIIQGFGEVFISSVEEIEELSCHN